MHCFNWNSPLWGGGGNVKNWFNLCDSNRGFYLSNSTMLDHLPWPYLSVNILTWQDKEMTAMSLGLAHSLSRYKLKFSPDKIDTMIVQAVSLLDDLDKELNNYIMRTREWCVFISTTFLCHTNYSEWPKTEWTKTLDFGVLSLNLNVQNLNGPNCWNLNAELGRSVF